MILLLIIKSRSEKQFLDRLLLENVFKCFVYWIALIISFLLFLAKSLNSYDLIRSLTICGTINPFFTRTAKRVMIVLLVTPNARLISIGVKSMLLRTYYTTQAQKNPLLFHYFYTIFHYLEVPLNYSKTTLSGFWTPAPILSACALSVFR